MKNLIAYIGLLLIMSMGFFLMPKQSYACSSKKAHSEQVSCKKMQATRHVAKGNCCTSNKHKKDCNENCKNGICKCTSISSFNTTVALAYSVKNHFAQLAKQKFSYKSAGYSSGYLSIWLPPKIS